MKKLLLSCSALLALVMAVPPTYALNDISGYQWEASVRYLADRGVVAGYPDGSFQPKRVLNRAELTKIVLEATFDPVEFQDAADDCFPDVHRGDWFSKYVCFAKEMGIVKGYSDGTFRPGAQITQPEGLKIVLESFYEKIPTSPGQWYQTYFDEADYSGMSYFARSTKPETHLLTRGEMAYFVAWNLDEEASLPDQIADEPQYSADEIEEVDDNFGWEDMSPEDCADDEEYDATDRQCYLIDEDSWDEASWDDNEEDLGDYYDQEYAAEEDGAFEETEGGDEDSKYVYDIKGNTISLVRTDGDTSKMNSIARDTAYHQEVWKRVMELIPAANRSNLQYFYIFSDGTEGTMAYVEPMDDGRWSLAVDAADAKADPRELTLTIIHEFGHTLTLGVDQVDGAGDIPYDQAEASCKPRYFTGDGCAKPNSFIEKFYESFWAGKTAKVYRRVQATSTEGDDSAVYEDNPSAFVTEYAATSVTEDIAESFAYFVFHDRPTGKAIKDDKVRFFEQFPSLMKLRKDMREGIVQ